MRHAITKKSLHVASFHSPSPYLHFITLASTISIDDSATARTSSTPITAAYRNSSINQLLIQLELLTTSGTQCDVNCVWAFARCCTLKVEEGQPAHLGCCGRKEGNEIREVFVVCMQFSLLFKIVSFHNHFNFKKMISNIHFTFSISAFRTWVKLIFF